MVLINGCLSMKNINNTVRHSLFPLHRHIPFGEFVKKCAGDEIKKRVDEAMLDINWSIVDGVLRNNGADGYLFHT